MTRLSRIRILAFALVVAGGSACGSCNDGTGVPSSGQVDERLYAPDGFRVTVFATDVPNARAMALGPAGTLFVGSRSEGNVYAVVDADGDGVSDQTHRIARGLSMPAGVDVLGGDLYVSAVSRVLRFDAIEQNLTAPPDPVIVNDTFPTDRSHGWKFIRFGPDGWLYVPVGAPCNICLSEDPRYASVMRMRPDGTGLEVFAHGVRNTVGFDWHPDTGHLWFTDNGRDHLGNDLPPDELNHAPRAGMHFGYPFCHGGDLADPEFGDQRPCSDFEPPAQKLGPHVASLGMRFYTGTMFPEPYRGAIFIAEHGSWNRDTPIGYRVTVVRLDAQGNAVSYEPFIEGWLGKDGEAWGRPADVLVHPDGSLYVSDDRAGWIYRVTYEN